MERLPNVYRALTPPNTRPCPVDLHLAVSCGYPGSSEGLEPVGGQSATDQEDEPNNVGIRRSRRIRIWAQSVILAFPVAWILVAGWVHRGITEDGFIYFRVVRHVQAGNGPVFNVGERVEVYTGTLWVGVLSVADLLIPLRLEWVAVLVGLVATAGAVGLAMAGSLRLWGSHEPGTLMLPAGVLVFVAVYPVWTFVTSGLETSLTFAWLGGCTLILARWADGIDPRPHLSACVVLGAGWLIRPEMVIYSAIFMLLIGMAQRHNGWRAVLKTIVAFTAVPVAYQVFRMGYFGSLVPNTAIAKEGSGVQLDRGWTYLRDLADPYHLWIPAVLLLGGGLLPLLLRLDLRSTFDRRRAGVLVTLCGGAVVNATYIVAVGGDYHHGRLLLPALFASICPLAVMPLSRRHFAVLGVVIWAMVAMIGLRPPQLTGTSLADNIVVLSPDGRVTVDEAGWGPDSAMVRRLDGDGPYYQAGLIRYEELVAAVADELPRRYVAMWGIGASGYGVGIDVHVLDMLGLADTLTAHLEVTSEDRGRGNRMAGHEKPLPAPWTAALITEPGSRPDSSMFPSLFPPLIPATADSEFQEQVEWARAAMACGPIAELLEAARAPLGPRQFVENIVRSPSHTRLRIPPDPETAYRTLCQDEVPPEVRELRAASRSPVDD